MHLRQHHARGGNGQRPVARAAPERAREAIIEPAFAAALRALVEEQRIASLGTLHAGEPYVSMVPFAIVPRARFVIHVSTLAAHTKDMLQDARVSLMIIAQPRGDVAPQGLGRVTLQGDATRIEPEDSRHAAAKAAYLARFPDSEPMFDFSDFSLFEVVPRAVRFVGGFAQARSLTPDTFAAVLHDAS